MVNIESRFISLFFTFHLYEDMHIKWFSWFFNIAQVLFDQGWPGYSKISSTEQITQICWNFQAIFFGSKDISFNIFIF